MNVLDELARLAPDTEGPNENGVAAARNALADAMGLPRSSRRRRRAVVAIATGLALVGAGAAAATVRKNAPSAEFAEFRSSVRLPDAKVLEVWAAPTANGLWHCPYLRIAPLAKRGDGDWCGFAADGFHDLYDPTGLSVQRERLDSYQLVALYGHAPPGAQSVTIEFAEGSPIVLPVRREWFVTVVPDSVTPMRARTQMGAASKEAAIPPPLPAVDGPQGPTCALQKSQTDQRPVPIRIPKPSKYPGTAKYADAKLIMQGRPLPDAAWGVLLMRDRGDAFVRLEHLGENDQRRGASGGSFDPGRLSASATTFTNEASILLGAATAKTACVVATDSLGRTTATTRLVRDKRFPTLLFWVMVVPTNATVRKIEALDSRGRRIDVFRFEGMSGHNEP